MIFNNQTLTATILLALGCLLVLQGFSASVRADTRIGVEMCRYVGIDRSTVVLGFLAGLRPCLPLITALIYSATLANVAESALFMTSFWLGSSIYTFGIGMIAGTLTGMASFHISMERIKRISGIALIVVAIVFLIEGAALLIKF